ATDQHADIGCRLAGDSELVLDLALHILGYAIAPEPRTKFPGGLALQYLHVTTTDDGVITVGQHPCFIRIGMLQYGVHTPNLVAGAFAVMLGDDGLQRVAPIERRAVVIGIELG